MAAAVGRQSAECSPPSDPHSVSPREGRDGAPRVGRRVSDAGPKRGWSLMTRALLFCVTI